MAKRAKRLKKTIEAIQKAIERHEEKKKLAQDLGQEELVEYYSKEIKSLDKRKEDRSKKLNR